MDDAELILWRIERLQGAIDHLTHGNKTAFARQLGHGDAAFIRQMLSGKRAIGEKLIRRVEALPGMGGWFSPYGHQAGSLQAQIRAEMGNREIPDHVLVSVLDLLKGFPDKSKKVA